jgi:hypothetical protein
MFLFIEIRAENDLYEGLICQSERTLSADARKPGTSDEHDGENETILGEKCGLPHICRPNDYRIFGLSAISLGSQSI